MSIEEYERATAIVAHTTISVSLSREYPHLTMRDRDEIFINILERLAQMRGWDIRRVCIPAEDDE